MIISTKPYAALTLAVLLSGCTILAPDTVAEHKIPQNWMVAGESREAYNPAEWWLQFNQPQLNVLIAEAFTYNSDLQLAAARVAEARAAVTGIQAERFPLLQGSADASRGNNNVAGRAMSGFSLGGLLSYELDLWGRLANADRAARARLLSVDANKQAVRHAVAAEVTRQYFTLLSLDWQMDVARRTIKTREDGLSLQQKRFEGGDIDALDFRQAEAQLAAARALLPSLQQQRDLSIHALSVLLGRAPDAIITKTLAQDISGALLPDVPPLPEIMLSEHIIYRPDLVAAEANIKAADADVGVARTAYLPRLSLNALLGVGSNSLDTLLETSAKQWSVAGGLLGPVLDFGRANAQVEAAQARQKQAYVSYEQTVRVAVREIMDALSVYDQAGLRLAAQNQQIVALRDAVRVAQKRYDAGYSSYLELLDAERNLLQVEIDSVATQNERLIAITNLYRALGHDQVQEKQ